MGWYEITNNLCDTRIKKHIKVYEIFQFMIHLFFAILFALQTLSFENFWIGFELKDIELKFYNFCKIFSLSMSLKMTASIFEFPVRLVTSPHARHFRPTFLLQQFFELTNCVSGLLQFGQTTKDLMNSSSFEFNSARL